MSNEFVPGLECPKNCNISFDPTVVPRLRLWFQKPDLGIGCQRWIAAMYQDCTWFVNNTDPKYYQAARQGKAETQVEAWQQMLEAAREIGWAI